MIATVILSALKFVGIKLFAATSGPFSGNTCSRFTISSTCCCGGSSNTYYYYNDEEKRRRSEKQEKEGYNNDR